MELQEFILYVINTELITRFNYILNILNKELAYDKILKMIYDNRIYRFILITRNTLFLLLIRFLRLSTTIFISFGLSRWVSLVLSVIKRIK